MKIKAVIFDVGGVLMYEMMPAIYADIKKTLKLDDHTFQKAWTEITPALSRGEITEDTYWQQFVAATKTTQTLPKQSMLQRHYKVIRNQKVYKIVTKLKEEGYTLALLSNTIQSHVAINKGAGIYDEFPIKILSNEVGIIKPNKDIFLLAIDALQTNPEETIFIDDLQANVDAANALGLQGIHFTDADDLLLQLQRKGITV